MLRETLSKFCRIVLPAIRLLWIGPLANAGTSLVSHLKLRRHMKRLLRVNRMMVEFCSVATRRESEAQLEGVQERCREWQALTKVNGLRGFCRWVGGPDPEVGGRIPEG